jgi:endonuclease-3 related protein
MCLSQEKLRALSTEALETRLRPVGYFRIKAKRLRHVLDYLENTCGGDYGKLFQRPLEKLRGELLSVHGIGPETADSILLYAGNLPVFVVDAYTCRIASRHDWIATEDDYHTVQKKFLATLPIDRQLYNEFHALLVRLGKDYCKRTRPLCETCPLRKWLPKHKRAGSLAE